jgi:uncharacterized protein
MESGLSRFSSAKNSSDKIKTKIIYAVANEVRRRLEKEGSGHDWWHIFRVWQMAVRIARAEKADLFVVQLAALLHDIADWKFHGGDDTIGPRVSRELLLEYRIAEDVITHVCEIIGTMAFKGAGVNSYMRTLEGKVVQDADRLDAVGAIGIARAFAYGGYKNRLIHDPLQVPTLHPTEEAYIHNESTSVNHFYEKLLLLRDRMNTAVGKELAEKRHRFMKTYLGRFFMEWGGKI